MSNYTKSTNFATKDTLPAGDTNKIVKGTEIDTEYNNIATAIATKADLASPTFTGTVTIPTLSATTGTFSTALAATSGGTGNSSYAVGDLLYASTTTALSKLADVATGSALISGGVGTAPSYGKIGLTTHVSGTLPVANGGTGITSAGTSGNVLVSDGSNFASQDISATQSEQETATTTTKMVTPGRQQYHPSAAKAWCKFDGTLTGTNSPSAGYNVTSVTRDSTGNYTINLTTAFSGTNYVVIGTAKDSPYAVAWRSSATSSFTVGVFQTGTGAYTDVSSVFVMAFGDQ